MNQEFKNEALEEIVEEQAAPVSDEFVDQFGPEQPPKRSKAPRIIVGILIGLVALVLIAAIAVGIIAAVMINKATVETPMPQKVESSNMTMFGAEAAVGLLADDQIIVGNDDMQMLMDKVFASVSSSLKGTPVELQDLYCQFANDQGTIYAKAYISELEVSGINLKLDKTVNVVATFDVNYEEPNIVAQIKELKCGDLSIPVNLVTSFAANISLPEGLSIDGDEICYDVSGLDAMLDEALPQAMSEGLGDNMLSNMLSDLLVEKTDVEITGADIVGDELVINGHLF